MTRNRFGQFCFAMACLFAASGSLAAQDHSAAKFLPASTAIYVHVADPAELIAKVESHPMVDYVGALKPVKELFKRPDVAIALLAKGVFESQLGEPIGEALKTITSDGLWLAGDPKTKAFALVFKSKDEDRLKRVAGLALKLIGSQAQREGKTVPFEKTDYRNSVAAKFDNLIVARYQDWFVVSTKNELAKIIVDNMHDGAKSSLASQEWFKNIRDNRKNADVWAAVDLKTIRSLVGNEPAFSGQTDNPGLELIFGGILDVLKHAPYAEGNLSLNESLSVKLSAPFNSKWTTESREFFFGQQLNGKAPRTLTPKKLIGSLTSYRDIGQWWLSKEELYPERVIAQLAQTDSQLSTIFSGMDFGEDVLGAFEPGVQIIATENRYDSDYVPDVKIPSFALVGRIKDPEKLQRKLRIAFQSVIGFANINLGMNGQPQLEVETEKSENTYVSSASYYYEEGTEEGLILFNFSPTIAFKGDNLIISSTKDLAVELASLVSNQSANEPVNTRLNVSGKMLHEILKQNSESLIAQNMLEEGNSRQEAATQVDIILSVLKPLKNLTVDLDVQPAEVLFNFELNLDQEEFVK